MSFCLTVKKKTKKERERSRESYTQRKKENTEKVRNVSLDTEREKERSRKTADQSRYSYTIQFISQRQKKTKIQIYYQRKCREASGKIKTLLSFSLQRSSFCLTVFYLSFFKLYFQYSSVYKSGKNKIGFEKKPSMEEKLQFTFNFII